MDSFAAGPIDPNSPVAADIRAAEAAPGGYPRFSKLPQIPTDVRPRTAWRGAVLSERAQKRQLEQEAAAIPFALKNSEVWASEARARISPDLSQPAPADARAQAEAFAAAERARATPPPPSK